MTSLDFLKKLNEESFEGNSISAQFHYFVSDCDETSFVIDRQIKDFIKNLPDESFSSFGTKLGRILTLCQEESKNAINIPDDSYKNRFTKLQTFISQISSLYSAEAKKKYKKTDSVSSTIAQHEDSLKEIKEKISGLNNSVKTANSLIDDKIFTLLINTVAILGIFVAIAFTGFGAMSIFSNIDLKISLTSEEAFVKNVFFLLLVCFFSYNLLLLLSYFIFKLSRPLYATAKKMKDYSSEPTVKDDKKESPFAISLIPFLWIDGTLCLLTIAMFVVCLIVY